ncbi:px domain containing protein [Nannochloropsis gaditana]|uniref:Px domain containing protein n=1 Tax=Nannochloropsis gaditana TaxID=72520 RepID=W7T372_9STRA|nr:px domain containing protein [Nannochloropsis gaditana]
MLLSKMGNQPPTKATLSGLVTRIWRYPYRANGQEMEVLIMLRHHRHKGEKIIYVDGQIVHHSIDRIDSGGIVSFEILQGKVPCELTVVDYPGLTSYSLVIRGRPWACDTEQADGGEGGRQPVGLSGNLSIESVTVASVALLPLDTEKGGDDREKRKTREDKLEDEVEEEEEETLLQSSSRGVVRSGGKAKVGAFYTLKTRWAATEGTGAEEGEQGANGRAGPKEKEHRFRFRDFDKLDVKIRSYFWGHHLASSLPRLPPKYLKALTAHTSPSFLEERRAALDAYMQRLQNFPYVQRNPDWQAFVLGEPGLR